MSKSHLKDQVNAVLLNLITCVMAKFSSYIGHVIHCKSKMLQSF